MDIEEQAPKFETPSTECSIRPHFSDCVGVCGFLHFRPAGKLPSTPLYYPFSVQFYEAIEGVGCYKLCASAKSRDPSPPIAMVIQLGNSSQRWRIKRVYNTFS